MRAPGARAETACMRNLPYLPRKLVSAVAAVVAIVILVFFGIGYLFGRLFL